VKEGGNVGLKVSLPQNVGPHVGLLSDGDIKAAVEAGYLLEREGFLLENAKYACYEIRVGSQYEVLKFDNDDVVHVSREIAQGQSIDIPPGATFLIIAEETFRIPTNIFAKITTVGQVFASGLAAENTFADPGYTGPLYLTMTNVSSRILSLKRGDPLARVEFHKLQNIPERTHIGYTGRRKSFISARLDTQVRELLRSKTAKELLQEMINESLDEAIQNRFARSEVLIEKAHREIDSLMVAQRAIRRIQIYSGIMVGIIVFALLQLFGVFSHFDITEVEKYVLELVIATVAGILAILFDKFVLSKRK
jgi:deoxycytidine triphosphate deaminase